MYCKNVERSNLAHFALGGMFLKNCHLTLSLYVHEASHGGYIVLMICQINEENNLSRRLRRSGW